MKKIAIIVQRYGEKVCGGGEYYAKQLAEHLSNKYDVEVITTTSLDYMAWDDFYEEGVSIDNGVKVIRFKPLNERNWDLFNSLSEDMWRKVKSNVETDPESDFNWVDAQGPFCPQMIEYLDKNKEQYDVVFVITYIYYTAVKAIPIIFDKCIFIPTAHDDVWIRLSIFKKMFSMIRYLAFLTDGEQEFVRNYFDNYCVPGKVVGFGIDLPQNICGNSFKEKYNIKDPYVVYVGRIDVSKNCDEMLEFFENYKRKYDDNLKLVLIGEPIIDIPNNANVIAVGYVSEEDKFNGIMASEAMICPSRFESLCIAFLEGMACGKPVLANKACAILEEQCLNSKAGFVYSDGDEFAHFLHVLCSDKDKYDLMSKKALEFIEKSYTWKIVLKKFDDIISFVADGVTTELGQRMRYLDRNIFDYGNAEHSVVRVDDTTVTIEPAFDKYAVTVCFISSDEFAPIVGVAVFSLIENSNSNRNYDILILVSDMNSYNAKLIKSMAKDKDNISIRFINIKNIVKNYHYKLASYYNEFTYYRLFIPAIMKKYDKVLYLDSDLVVNKDVADLYDTNIDNYLLAAVTELTVLCWQLFDKEHVMKQYLDGLGMDNIGGYVQGGVALYNVRRISNELPISELLKIATRKKFLMADQDIINVYCKNRIKIVHNRWNVVNMNPINMEMYNKILPQKYFDEYKSARENPFIVHFSGQLIPCYDSKVDLYHYFWQYARKTPFYEYLLNKHLENRMFSLENKHAELKQDNNEVVHNKKHRIRKIADKILPMGTRRRKIVKTIYLKLFFRGDRR